MHRLVVVLWVIGSAIVIPAIGCTRNVRVWAVDAVTGQPVEGAEVHHHRYQWTLFAYMIPTRWDVVRQERRTDANGIADLGEVEADDWVTVWHVGSGRTNNASMWPERRYFDHRVAVAKAKAVTVIADRAKERALQLGIVPCEKERTFVVVPIYDQRSLFGGAFKTMENLQVEREPVDVALAGAAITDNIVSVIAAKDTIRFVTLGWTSVTDDGLHRLASIPHVMSIDLYHNPAITSDGVQRAGTLRDYLFVHVNTEPK